MEEKGAKDCNNITVRQTASCQLRLLWPAVVLLVIVVASVPLAHAATSPGVPILYISSQSGPYTSGQNVEIQFQLRNLGSDTINGLTLDVKPANGWFATAGSVNIGTLSGGQQVIFSIDASIGNVAFPSIVFTARSTDHVTVDFPVSVLVSTSVTPQIIAEQGEQISSVGNLVDQGITYTVNEISGSGTSIYFPTTQSGMTSSSGMSDLLQGYYIDNFLANPSNSLGSAISSISNLFSTITSDAAMASTQANQGYTISVGSLSFTGLLYEFLTWQIPFSKMTGGLISDWGVPDMLAWAIQQFGGPNISANDIIQLANMVIQFNTGSLLNYASDANDLAQLISQIFSSTPDTTILQQVLTEASQVANELGSALQILNSLNGLIQNVISGVRWLAQQIDQVFQWLTTWISNHIPLISTTINSFLDWLWNGLKGILSSIADLFDKSSQAQSFSQSSENILSGMAGWVQQESSSAFNNLEARLSQIEEQASQALGSACESYTQMLPALRSITPWIAPLISYATTAASSGSVNPPPAAVIAGMGLIENTADAGCSYLTTGADPITVIAEDYGANTLLNNLLPNEEGTFNAIGGLLNYLGLATPAVNQLIGTMSSSGYDLSAVSSVVSSYQSAVNQGISAYQSKNYMGALVALGSLTGLVSLGAVQLVLQEVQPCADVQSELLQYSQEGLVAPDLQTQTQACQQASQSAISAIASGDYSAVTKASGLMDLASQIESVLETRHQQFIAAKSAVSELSAAVSSLSGCEFLWVQPDPNQLSSADQALQLAQSQFAAGQYSGSMNTANAQINQVITAGQSCRIASSQAKLELGGAIVVAIVVAALLGFAHIRRRRKS